MFQKVQCTTLFVYFLDLLLVRYNCTKFHYCEICVTYFTFIKQRLLFHALIECDIPVYFSFRGVFFKLFIRYPKRRYLATGKQTKTVVRKCSVCKISILKILQISQKNTCAGACFTSQLQAVGLKLCKRFCHR